MGKHILKMHNNQNYLNLRTVCESREEESVPSHELLLLTGARQG